MVSKQAVIRKSFRLVRSALSVEEGTPAGCPLLFLAEYAACGTVLYVEHVTWSGKYIDTAAINALLLLGSPGFAGQEEEIFRTECKIRVLFGGCNPNVHYGNEPRYTPSPLVQKRFGKRLTNILYGPDLPEGIGYIGTASRYRGVFLLRPWEVCKPPSMGTFIETTFKDVGGIETEQLTDALLTARKTLRDSCHAFIARGVVHYFDGFGSERVVCDSDQLLEQEILQVLAAHGAGEILAKAGLEDFGFTREQVGIILGPPQSWVLQSTWSG